MFPHKIPRDNKPNNPLKMVKFSTAIQLLPLLLLTPNKSAGSHRHGSVVVANGFAPSHLHSSLNSRQSTSSYAVPLPSFLPRGGSQDVQPSSVALSSTSSSLEPDVGPALEVISQDNWDLLSDRGKAALSRLILYDMSSGHNGQKHVYGDWPDAGVDDAEKIALAEQVRFLCAEK